MQNSPAHSRDLINVSCFLPHQAQFWAPCQLLLQTINCCVGLGSSTFRPSSKDIWFPIQASMLKNIDTFLISSLISGCRWRIEGGVIACLLGWFMASLNLHRLSCSYRWLRLCSDSDLGILVFIVWPWLMPVKPVSPWLGPLYVLLIVSQWILSNVCV